MDLKPTLDGYAGVPQETRLLFLGLRSAEEYSVEGLIQHGSRNLKSAIPTNRKALATSKRINRLSKVVVSLYEKPYSSLLDNASEAVTRYVASLLLHARARFGRAIPTHVFEPDLFDDFIWRTFFSKTLKPINKDLITSTRYRVLRQPRSLLHKSGLAALKYTSTPRYPSVDTRGFDFFVAQTPFPGRTSPGTRLVVRYHDAVPVLMPHTIGNKAFHQASHFYSLQDNVRSGAWFSCISEATRKDLLKIFPEAEPRTAVIHNMVSGEYFDEDSPKGLVFNIIANRLCDTNEFGTELSGISLNKAGQTPQEFDYLLMVSTIEPRKNHLLLMEAWERLKYTSMPNLKLVIVGNSGWDEKPILKAFKPWAERGDLFHLANVPAFELRILYKHALATICPSLAEGFDYSGIEAMRSGGIVISSDISVHREVYEDASEYFSPYSSEDAAQVIQSAIRQGGASLRARLVQKGREISGRYTPSLILPQWNEFFRAASANGKHSR
ncbi:MAG TPA: glycosyltransferase family 1 protein [Aromatoleum sp.]|uniref:glycosyltransferase family 4 protein n=1 Tax=Aromatoleum sp. TaxID=2307007 RepID=UPI002B48EDCE|nr:glycosyltransferase family 1 protein [Aromatoleum sp.]HJV25551.1 glycosyltransferase family 1 protein [Aromatoleum sp.]